MRHESPPGREGRPPAGAAPESFGGDTHSVPRPTDGALLTLRPDYGVLVTFERADGAVASQVYRNLGAAERKRTRCHERGLRAELLLVRLLPVGVQLGDHDPSGVDAWRNFEEKVRGFVPGARVTFERIAVLPSQITELGLLTRPTKKSDTRSAGFTGESVEVDAIPPSTLRTIAREAVEQHIDTRALELTRSVEASERSVLTSLIGGGVR